jgi:hypothetical protein
MKALLTLIAACLLTACTALGGSGDPVFNTINGVAITGDANTITLGKGTTTLSLTGTGSLVPSTRTVNGHALSADVTVTKGDLSLGNVENTALSTWAGTTNVITLGTVTTGVWHGTAIADGYIATALTGKTYNGMGITANSGTLHIGNAKTFDCTATITLTGTDGRTLNIGGGGTLAALAFKAACAEGELSLSDVTTSDVSTARHGFAPKAPNDATKFLNGANPPAFTDPLPQGLSTASFPQFGNVYLRTDTITYAPTVNVAMPVDVDKDVFPPTEPPAPPAANSELNCFLNSGCL